MFNKIITFFLVINLIFINLVFAMETRIIIHYKKSDAYYENTKIHIIYGDKVDVQNFNNKDEFGGILNVEMRFREQLKIQIYDNDILIDEFLINMYINNEVWKEESNEEVKYYLPAEYSSKYKDEEVLNVKVYYKRYDNDYSNKKILIINDDKNKVYNFNSYSYYDYAYATIEIKKGETYYFNILDNGKVIDFEKGVIYGNSIYDNQIYLLQDKSIPFYDNEVFNNEKTIESAYIEEDGNIYVKLYTKAKVQNNLTEGFTVSKLNGDNININYVEPVSVINNKYCDQFTINVSNLDIKSKYVISKLDYNEIYLSKKLMYDTDEYNHILSNIKNLGVNVENNITKFNLFYPNGERAEINILQDNEVTKVYNFDKVENDVWQFETEDDLLGKSYNYKIFLNGNEYIVKEPFSKIIDKNGNSVVYNINKYNQNNNMKLGNENYNAIYKQNINTYISFFEEVVEVSSLVKSYTHYKDIMEINHEEVEEKQKEEQIKNVYVKYYLYEEGEIDEANKKKIEEIDEDMEMGREVVPVFNINETNIKEYIEVENYYIENIDIDEVETDFDYSHFYFDYGENFEIIRLNDNINKVKNFINEIHKKNKKVIFNYTIDYNKIQYLCDEYYYSNGYINTNRIITQKSIYEDIQFLIDVYNIDGLTFDLNYYDGKFIEKVQNEFDNIKIIGINGKNDNKEKFYNIFDFDLNSVNADENKNIYKVNSLDNIQFELFMILLNNSTPFFNNIKFENLYDINEFYYNSSFLLNNIQGDIEVLYKDDNYTLLKIKSMSDEFDYYTVAINLSENEYMITIPSKNNKLLVDDMGFYEDKEYIYDNLILKPKSVYVLKTSNNNVKYSFNYENLIPYIIILLFLILLVLIIKRRRKIKNMFI